MMVRRFGGRSLMSPHGSWRVGLLLAILQIGLRFYIEILKYLRLCVSNFDVVLGEKRGGGNEI